MDRPCPYDPNNFYNHIQTDKQTEIGQKKTIKCDINFLNFDFDHRRLLDNILPGLFNNILS